MRHEYISGELHAMVGTSERHNLIAGNLFAVLRPLVRGTPCQFFMADTKLITVAGEAIFYHPDLMLACDPNNRARYYRQRSCLRVEVLADASDRVDRARSCSPIAGSTEPQGVSTAGPE